MDQGLLAACATVWKLPTSSPPRRSCGDIVANSTTLPSSLALSRRPRRLQPALEMPCRVGSARPPLQVMRICCPRRLRVEVRRLRGRPRGCRASLNGWCVGWTMRRQLSLVEYSPEHGRHVRGALQGLIVTDPRATTWARPTSAASRVRSWSSRPAATAGSARMPVGVLRVCRRGGFRRWRPLLECSLAVRTGCPGPRTAWACSSRRRRPALTGRAHAAAGAEACAFAATEYRCRSRRRQAAEVCCCARYRLSRTEEAALAADAAAAAGLRARRCRGQGPPLPRTSPARPRLMLLLLTRLGRASPAVQGAAPGRAAAAAGRRAGAADVVVPQPSPAGPPRAVPARRG